MLQFKILVWNCRGLVNTETQTALISLVRQVRPSIIFLSETLASPSLLDSIRGRLGFHGCICSPWLPKSRGLALFWLNDVPVRLRHYSTNHIDIEVGLLGSAETWRFTGIYGFASNGDRVRTWDLMRTLAAQSSLPWLVAGDFNEILSNSEKSGGPPRGAAPMARFRGALVDCGLTDMGFSSSKFTWSNRFTKERLDRACSTPSWNTLYPCSRVIILSPSKSDHNPLLLDVSVEPIFTRRKPKRFRFEEMWSQHGDSSSIIQKGWTLPSTGDSMAQVCSKIRNTGQLLMEWHVAVFQQRQNEMKLIQHKLDILMSKQYSPEQFDEQNALCIRYNELLSLDETYWKQRSRVLWLKEGDRNTAFFHRKASNRRSRNKIQGLIDEVGV